jgi:hypothetical protein
LIESHIKISGSRVQTKKKTVAEFFWREDEFFSRKCGRILTKIRQIKNEKTGFSACMQSPVKKNRTVVKQGCKMVCFQIKNPNLGKFWRAFEW